MIKTALILAAYFLVTSSSPPTSPPTTVDPEQDRSEHDSSSNQHQSPPFVSVHPVGQDGLSAFIISLVIVLVLCLIMLITTCLCFRFDRYFVDAARGTKARFESYDRMSDDVRSKKCYAANKNDQFGSNRNRNEVGDALKKTANIFMGHLNWTDQPNFNSSMSTHTIQQTKPISDETRSNSLFSTSPKETSDKTGPLKLSDQLVKEYRDKKSSARKKQSNGTNEDIQRRFMLMRKLSDTKLMQRKLLPTRKFPEGTSEDLQRKLEALRKFSATGSEGDLWKYRSAFRNVQPRSTKPRMKQLAGHSSFLTYEHEDRFSSAWEARACLLDPKRVDELANMSEGELDSYCIYFNVEEWQQVKRKWALVRKCGTIDEAGSEEESVDSEDSDNFGRDRTGTMVSQRRTSFRAMLKTVPSCGGSTSRQTSIQGTTGSEEDMKSGDDNAESPPPAAVQSISASETEELNDVALADIQARIKPKRESA